MRFFLDQLVDSASEFIRVFIDRSILEIEVSQIGKMVRPWGHMTKVYGIKQISVSPMQLSAWKTLPQDWINVFKRYVVDYWQYPVIPLTLTYFFYDWGKKTNERLNRKNAADYASDE